MEYQREEENGQKSEVQIVKPISSLIENENPKTRWEEFADVVSRWKAPGLKTIGRLSHVLYNSKIPGLFRHEWLVEAIAVLASGDQMVAFLPTWGAPDIWIYMYIRALCERPKNIDKMS